MVIDTSKLGSWKSSTAGLVAAIGQALTAYVQSGNKIDFHNPMFYSAIATVIWAWYTKDKNVTGGNSPNPSSDPAVVAKTATPEPPKP